MHLSVFEFASVGLPFVRFLLTKDVGVSQNYVVACVDKVHKKTYITLSRLCYHLYESARGTNLTICFVHHIYAYGYISIKGLIKHSYFHSFYKVIQNVDETSKYMIDIYPGEIYAVQICMWFLGCSVSAFPRWILHHIN